MCETLTVFICLQEQFDAYQRSSAPLSLLLMWGPSAGTKKLIFFQKKMLTAESLFRLAAFHQIEMPNAAAKVHLRSS